MSILFLCHRRAIPEWFLAPRNGWIFIICIDMKDFMLRWSTQLLLAAENELRAREASEIASECLCTSVSTQ